LNKPGNDIIPVCKTDLPPIDDYIVYLQGIWERHQLTNNGPLVKELEIRLCEYLGVKHCLLVSSGTIALQLAIKALGVTGEIITTPFSFVATASAQVWEGCRPVFADIDPASLCLSPARIEEAIRPETEAIIATHIYGNPCDIEAIAAIAARHKLRLIYDASHAFGVKYLQGSLLAQGDISTLSFHATKLFYTGEGGAVVCSDDHLAEKVRRLRDFGINGPEAFYDEVGINGKMSELHAALGLAVLPTIPEVISKRKQLCDLYDLLLKGTGLSKPACPAGTDYNYSFYPVLFPNEEVLKQAQQIMNDAGIFPRRYFYPPLTRLTYVQSKMMPVAEDAASRILCLPLYAGLAADKVEYICSLIIQTMAGF